MTRFALICALLAACRTVDENDDTGLPEPPPREKPPELPAGWTDEVKIPSHLERLSREDEAFVVTAERALHSSDFATQAAAASGLAELGEPVTPYLGYIGERRTKAERTFRIVANVLAPVFTALEPERLGRYLVSPYRAARATAAQVAGERDLMEYAAALVALLEDGDLEVRRAAIVSLRTMTNRFYGYHPEATASRRAAPVRRWRELLGSG